jgi:hypothetical protein
MAMLTRRMLDATYRRGGAFLKIDDPTKYRLRSGCEPIGPTVVERAYKVVPLGTGAQSPNYIL